MKRKVFGLLALLIGSVSLSAQNLDSLTADDDLVEDEAMEETVELKRQLVDLGRFNYAYLRIAFLRPMGEFNNPFGGDAFPGAAHFPHQTRLPNGALTLGLESGRVRHFNKLNLGTPMVKLGINSGFAIHAFGPGSLSEADFEAETLGTYLVRLGVGPQFTFKPIPEVRVGLYYRAGIALAYSSYHQLSSNPDDGTSHEINIQTVNYAYNGDLGLDVSYGMLSIGLSYSHMGTQLTKGQLFNIGDIADGYNSYNFEDETDEVSTPIDPRMKYHRFGVSVGITF